jgi:hypothetical protein
MKTIYLFLLPAFACFACAGLQAQKMTGSQTKPAEGAFRNSTPVKSLLVLSRVVITDYGKIPANTFTGIDSEQDSNIALRGLIVYHTGTKTIPAGVYVWNGYYWSHNGNCNPIITAASPSSVTVIEGQSTALEITAEGCDLLSYQWYASADASTAGENPINNANSAIYHTPATSTVGMRYYFCVISSSLGSTTSGVFAVNGKRK